MERKKRIISSFKPRHYPLFESSRVLLPADLRLQHVVRSPLLYPVISAHEFECVSVIVTWHLNSLIHMYDHRHESCRLCCVSFQLTQLWGESDCRMFAWRKTFAYGFWQRRMLWVSWKGWMDVLDIPIFPPLSLHTSIKFSIRCFSLFLFLSVHILTPHSIISSSLSAPLLPQKPTAAIRLISGTGTHTHHRLLPILFSHFLSICHNLS